MDGPSRRPTEQCRREGMPSHSEAPSGGAKPFAYFLVFEKVSRCKSETIGSRYRRNGYVLRKQSPTSFDAAWINVGRGSGGGRHRLTDRLRVWGGKKIKSQSRAKAKRSGLTADLIAGLSTIQLWERACSRRGHASRHPGQLI